MGLSELTHCPLGHVAWILNANFQMHCSDYFHNSQPFPFDDRHNTLQMVS